MSPAPYAFDVDTRVEAVADHRFAAAITDRWNVLGGRPNGGYVMGVCLQALTRVMPSPDPLVVSAFFLRPTQPGPAEVQTAVVRTGRRISTGEATLYQDGKETLRVTAAFSDLRQAAGVMSEQIAQLGGQRAGRDDRPDPGHAERGGGEHDAAELADARGGARILDLHAGRAADVLGQPSLLLVRPRDHRDRPGRDPQRLHRAPGGNRRLARAEQPKDERMRHPATVNLPNAGGNPFRRVGAAASQVSDRNGSPHTASRDPITPTARARP